MLYTLALSLLENRNTMEMNPEAWVAVFIFVLATAGSIVAIWVKTKSEIEVMKSEIKTLREMVMTQIAVDKEIKETLVELKIGQGRLEERLKAIHDK